MDPAELAAQDLGGVSEPAPLDSVAPDAPAPSKDSPWVRLVKPWRKAPEQYRDNPIAQRLNVAADNATQVEAAADAQLGESLVLCGDAMLAGKGAGGDLVKIPLVRLGVSLWKWRATLAAHAPQGGPNV